MRQDEFSRSEARWARRPIFGQPRRRRWPWGLIGLIALAALLGGGAYVITQPQLRPALADQWSRAFPPAPRVAPNDPQRLSLPAQPSAAR
jgi:hypothetical protein